MGHLDGLVAIGSYDSTPAANVAELQALLGDPDELVTNERAAGSNLDEMSPIARAQLYAELDALSSALALGADGVAYGTHTVTAAEDTAGLVDIVTGLADTAAAKYSVSVWRSGTLDNLDLVISEPSAGTLRVADGSTGDILEDDIIVWFAIDPAA